MIIKMTVRAAIAGLSLTLAAGCASVTDRAAPATGATSDAPAKAPQDSAGSRRVQAGAGRT